MPTHGKGLRKQVTEMEAQFGQHAYLLYAMGLKLRTMDYGRLAADCVLDGPDDKKIDFFHIDYDTGVATIAQSYLADHWDRRRDPPANKASDLNTALAWLLKSNLDDIPRPDIRTYAEELRDALVEGTIGRLEVYYVHNLKSSGALKAELATIKNTAHGSLAGYCGPEGEPAGCEVFEAGRDAVTEWAASHDAPITVHDKIKLKASAKAAEVVGPEWRAYVASISADQIVDLAQKYGNYLTSANLRDYLGSRQSTRNINQQIERTAREDPSNFWVFNNGVTVLSGGVEARGKTLTLTGIAVINGAQTVGSLRKAAESGSIEGAHVLVRVIVCQSQQVIESVITFNNTQNPLKPWELRANDPVQAQLVEDFRQLGVNYQIRRSARRASYGVTLDALAPCLSAFYGDPIASHKNKRGLSEDDAQYRNLFNDNSRAENLLLAYRLYEGIGKAKAEIKERIRSREATERDASRDTLFRHGGFAYVLLHVCAEVLGVWFEPGAPDYRQRVSFSTDLLADGDLCEQLTSRLAEQALIHTDTYLDGRDAYQELKTQQGVKGIVKHTRSAIESLSGMDPKAYSEFKTHLCLVS